MISNGRLNRTTRGLASAGTGNSALVSVLRSRRFGMGRISCWHPADHVLADWVGDAAEPSLRGALVGAGPTHHGRCCGPRPSGLSAQPRRNGGSVAALFVALALTIGQNPALFVQSSARFRPRDLLSDPL